MTSVADDRLLTAAEVAEILAVPERWVRHHTRGGLIRHLRLGRYVLYRRGDVLTWLDDCERGGAAWRKQRPRHVVAAADGNSDYGA
jgi:excisionase family DNA binding protein